MSQKPETRFSNLLLSKLHKDVYFEKTNNRFVRGIPDYYFEGPKDIMWAEMKWIQKPWTKILAPEAICKTTSWVGQRAWLERAHKNGRYAYVVVGIGSGRNIKCYVLSFPYAYNLEEAWTIKQTTDFIESKVL